MQLITIGIKFTMIRHMFIIHLLLLVMALSGQTHSFIEIEAEQYSNQAQNQLRKWEVMHSDNKAILAGKKTYIQCLPDTRITHQDSLIKGENFSDKPGNLAVLSYEVDINQVGRYYVWVRAYSTGSEDNGVHLGLDMNWPNSGQRIQWCKGKNNWTWSNSQRTAANHCGEPHLIYLDITTKGKHTINFSMREDGFAMDKFILTTDVNYDPNSTLKRAQIYIRDPFIFADAKTNTYYMYSSVYDLEYIKNPKNGVMVYKSKDLENWSFPTYSFVIPKEWWASDTHRSWAPEVHEYMGKYYMLATFSNPNKKLKSSRTEAITAVRGTAILVSDSLDGIFHPLSANSTTPPEWMALDGTLFIEENKPYMVFCHEWIQVEDGTMEAIALSKDLSTTKGKTKTLFRATDAKWVKKLDQVKAWNTDGYITDGPWFYRTKNNKLLMLWSSFGEEGYAVGLAESKSGRLHGPWTQNTPLFKRDGGHAMIFNTFNNKMILTLHQPNSGDIRARFFELYEHNNTLEIGNLIPFD